MPTESIRSGPVWSRAEFLFAGTAIMLLTGVLIPWPDRLLDLLWISHLSLTAAVLLICLLAGSSSQLDGFPPLAAAASFLSLLATAGCMRAIVLRHDTCGRLVRALGDMLTSLEPLLALFVIPVIGFFLLYLVLQSGRRIRLAIEHYLFQILPFKKIGLETDQTLHILTVEQGQMLLDKIRKEARFFVSMNGLRKLLAAQISVNLFLLLTAGGLAWMGQMLQTAAGRSLSPLEVLAPVLAGTAIFSWVPAGLTAAACAALLSKESLALPRSDLAAEQYQSRKIRIISSVSGQPEEIEWVNPDPVSAPPSQSRPAEQIASFEPQPTPSAPTEAQPVRIHCSSSQQYYRGLETLFTHKSLQSRLLVLTAESVRDLPVAVAVHPAIHLAQKKQKVLLIDADRRNAVARVFSMAPRSLQKPAPVPRMDSLHLQVLPEEKGWTLSEASEFSYRILYAPQIDRGKEVLSEIRNKNATLFFFSEKTPDQASRMFPDVSGPDGLFVLPPLHAAVKPAD